MTVTRSLRGQTLSVVLAVFLLVAVAVGVLAYRDVARQLEADLAGLLEARRATAGEVLVRNAGDLEATAQDLATLRIAARIIARDGTDLSVPLRDVGAARSALDVREGATVLSSTILTGSGQIDVLVSRESTDRILGRFRILLVSGLAVGTALLLAIVSGVLSISLRPLDQVREVMQRVTEGAWSERVRPDETSTEIGTLADDLDTMLDVFEAAALAARTAEQSQRRFLADVAHQLRTPMAGVRVSTELLLLQGDHSPEERERLLSNLVRETTRATRMVNGLLRISRFDLGDGVLLVPTDLVELCRQEVSRQDQLAEVPVMLKVIQAPETPVLIDPDQFREALANLLDNARRFAHSRIEVTVTELDDGQSIVRVLDDGPGLAPEDRERAFERFVTFDSGVGTGLGLPIARGIVRAHGGELAFHDGAFEIRLPGALG